MKEKIIILPCNGDCAAGKITWIATQQLVLEGEAEWYALYREVTGESEKEIPQLFIIVDGCDKQCLYNDYLEKGLLEKHRLCLSNLGIEPVHFQDLTGEDIELTKDAIIAECTEVDTEQPVLFSGCCCR